jgi:hypothetical protein|tara:strand:+ start:930 stop:1169 length:240 start_codon:yes stop_codon:yes gene_type:complete
MDLIVLGLVKGFVGGQKATISGDHPSLSRSQPSACKITHKDGAVAPESRSGLRNGVSAPYLFEIAAISSEFVETITLPD